MASTRVRMYLPTFGGAQMVNAADVPAWERRGGYVLPELTADEIAAEQQRVLDEKASLEASIAAQKAADALRLRDAASANGAASPAPAARPAMSKSIDAPAA